MDIQDLKLFRHLAGSLHFGRTSQACNITPSGLTRTIQRLEAELNKQLFVRDNRSVALTPAGKTFWNYAEDAIQRWNELQKSLSADSVLRGELSIYCSVTAILGILPEILGRFRTAYPKVHINLQTGDAAMALARLQNGEVDVTIAALPDKRPPQLEFIKLVETPLLFIAPARFPETVLYTADGSIDWRRTPLIIAERGLSRTRAQRWFIEERVVPTIYAQVAGNEAIITMVSLGCGVGIVPALVLEKSPLQDQVTILDPAPQLEPFSVGICTVGKNRTNPIVQAFWKTSMAGPFPTGHGPPAMHL
ncbi:MAG: HTH-type transcriptional activator IlvY [Desulfocapsaceae bacterium]|nr:HTH-type transcriptional activator IlvY [Desulfocapsaceae bacterium]